MVGFAITGIAHVGVRVRDLDRARRFYERLGFVDTGLRENTEYFYRLYVADTGNLTTAGRQISGTWVRAST